MSPNFASHVSGVFKRHYILTGFFVFIIAVVGWWKYEFPSTSWRYKLTVTVETPEGIKTGSVVRETRAELQIKLGEISGGSAGTAGEALVLDLGKRGVLFGLTEELDPVSYIIGGGPPAATREGMEYYSHLENAKADLLKANYKLQFVTFDEIDNSLTVKAVDIHNLSATFGAGVQIKSFILETTKDPLTNGLVDSRLRWLKNLGGGYLDGKFLGGGPQLSNILHGGNFRKGF